MRPAQSLLPLAVCLSPLATLASASAWPGWLPGINALPRADEPPKGSSASQGTASTAVSNSDTKTAPGVTTDDKASKPTVGVNTADPTRTGKDSSNKATTTTKKGKTTPTDIPPDAAPGGINMLTPPPNPEPTLFKIGDNISLGWNYTSLLVTPRAVDVFVSCSVASDAWALTTNMSFATSVDFLWDTKKEANSVEKPLLVQLYTLIVKDADADITAAPKPGFLGAASASPFGLYTPQPYTPYSEWTCPGCSDAPSLFSRQALGLAMTMSLVTFFSFTWFVAGLGLH